jgi:hypothetical protein
MSRARVRDDEPAILLLMVAGGLAWRSLSLVVGFSWVFAGATGAARTVLTVCTLPLHLTYWLGSTLRVSAVDVSGLMLCTGAMLGLILGIVSLAVLRWRER